MQRLLTKCKSQCCRPTSTSIFPSLKYFSSIYKPRGDDKSPYNLKVGDSVQGFHVKVIEEIPLYSMKAFALEHDKTKAKYLHLHCMDQNNCFAVGFRTTPKDNKGTSHILEKLMLCGSTRYPVRDPFAHMVKRSLNNQMNAWTGTDFTTFLFSTHNQQDFENLMSVYLESVYNPLLDYYDFLNEAWHYEFLREDNPDSELLITGGVYNQMKGYHQTPDNIFIEAIQSNLYNETPYKNCAGGIPKDIAFNSYEEIKENHKRLYHPSNSFFYSYGDLDFLDHLKYLENNFLKQFEYQDPQTSVPLQKRENIPLEYKISCPPSSSAIDPRLQSQFAVSYLCNDITQDPITSISLNILSYMLFETPESPFYQALLESGRTTGYCAGYGFDMNTREASFTIGAKNLSSNYGEMMQINQLIEDTLKKVVDEGFSQDFIESILHQVEFQAKLPKIDFGVSVLQSLIPLLNHGGDPIAFLKINQTMGEIRKRLRKGKYFESLIEKFFINNKHQIRVIMTPDKNFIKDQSENEEKALKEIQKNMNMKEKERIIRQNKELELRLGEIQDINILPDLKDSDIPRTTPPINFSQTEIMGRISSFFISLVKGIPFYFTHQPTNGITYFRMKFDLKDIPQQYRQYLKLFCQLFPRLGTKTTKADELMQLFDLYTYNFELQHVSISSPKNLNEYKEYLQLSIACLDKNIEHMFNYLTEILSYPDFKDYKNISELIKIFSSEAANSLVEDSLSYALSYAAGGFSIGSERTEKLQNTRFICELGASFLKTTQVKDILVNLERNLLGVFNNIFKQQNITFCVHGNKDIYEQVHRRTELLCHTIKGERELFSQATKSEEKLPENSQQDEKLYKTYFPLPMQTNYVIEAFPIPHFAHPDTAKLHTLAELLSSNVLVKEIKEEGGAFEGGVHINPNGVLSFYSYRDPHFLQTYQSFEKGIQWAANGEFTLQQIKEAKLQALSKIDQAESPLDKGLKLLFNGINNELRDEYRQRILDTTKEDLVSVANKYLLDKIKEGKTSQVIFGSQSNDLEGLLSRGWKIERPVEGLSVNEDSYEQNKSSAPRLTFDI